jgi:hypothetical protein
MEEKRREERRSNKNNNSAFKITEKESSKIEKKYEEESFYQQPEYLNSMERSREDLIKYKKKNNNNNFQQQINNIPKKSNNNNIKDISIYSEKEEMNSVDYSHQNIIDISNISIGRNNIRRQEIKQWYEQQNKQLNKNLPEKEKYFNNYDNSSMYSQPQINKIQMGGNKKFNPAEMAPSEEEIINAVKKTEAAKISTWQNIINRKKT